MGSPIYYVYSREVKLQAATDNRIRVQLQRSLGCLWLISAHVFVLKLTGNTGLFSVNTKHKKNVSLKLDLLLN